MAELKPNVSSKLPKPKPLCSTAIPRFKPEADTKNSFLPAKRGLRRSVSVADMRSATSIKLTQRNVTRPISASAAPGPSKVAGISRKRPANSTVAGGQNAAKKPLLQVNVNKRNAIESSVSAKSVAKIPAWDKKRLLECAESKIKTLEQQLIDLNQSKRQLEEKDAFIKELEESVKRQIEEKHAFIKELQGSLENQKALYQQILTDNTNMQKEVQQLKEELVKCTEERESFKAALNRKEKEMKDLISSSGAEKENFSRVIFEMHELRRKMHNQILDLKGNIRVFCRVRGALESESNKTTCFFTYPNESTIEIGPGTSDLANASQKIQKTSFTYDRVFPPNTKNSDIFLEISQLVQSALDGYNVCIFAYGQTGSGKTFTMEGGSDFQDQGLIPRSAKTIFEIISQQSTLGWKYSVKCSFLEIYNENIKDLLKPNSGVAHEVKKADAHSDDIIISNLTVETINNEEDLLQLLRISQKNRFTASTIVNERSSRSHSITQIRIEGENNLRNTQLQGIINLIDLAGSEKYSFKNGNDRQAETCQINKSLASLSLVVLKLAEKADHVPFRDSKLTHILMPSLRGNSKTLMLVNISPFEECYNETMSSLKFASRVSNVKVNSVRQLRTMSSASKCLK